MATSEYCTNYNSSKNYLNIQVISTAILEYIPTSCLRKSFPKVGWSESDGIYNTT